MNENSNQLIRLPVDASDAPAADGAVRVELPPPAGLSGSSYPAMPTDLGGTLRLLHRSLRGRYLLVVVLTFAAGALGGYAGWILGRPVFRSEALLRIAYTLPEVMQETDQNKPLAQYDAFMSSQRLLITSRKVIDRAMQDPVWKSTGHRLPEKPDR